jgi:hypothetical protein
MLPKGGASYWAKRMSETVDDFINRVRSHPAFQIGAWVRRTDDLEAVLRALFLSDDECAIELSDQIRGVIERKHVSVEKHELYRHAEFAGSWLCETPCHRQCLRTASSTPGSARWKAREKGVPTLPAPGFRRRF